MLKTQFALSTIVASLVLAGCASVGPDYQRPQLDVPAKLAVSGATTKTDFVEWWSTFRDPVLLELIQEAAKIIRICCWQQGA
jgi:outer membrane protein TolC